MPLKALIFPQTALRQTTLAALSPLFRPVAVLAPPSLDPQAPVLPGAEDLLEVIRPGGNLGADQNGSQEARRVAKVLREWEAWARDHQKSGVAAALKAGLEPPPPPETFRTVMRELKDYQDLKAGQPPLPEVDADLFLHLAHVRDREAADLEEALGRFESGRQALSKSMGKEEEDYVPTEYEGYATDELPPLDYSLGEDHLLERRLAAWATLTARVAWPGGAWLATASPAAAELLLSRANARLLPPEPEYRSPAGATSPLAGFRGQPAQDSPLARELAKLPWPNLGFLGQAELLSLAQALEASPGFGEVRQGFEELLGELAGSRFAPTRAGELAARAGELAQTYRELVEAALPGRGNRPRHLSLAVFPGLTLEQVLSLMREEEPAGLPPAAAWPAAWPAGSTPLLIVW
ncbi:MAG: hypothetical protein KQJ78_24110 [Deltaproteobacteria bacterium]|nr:hypothetical protein [Deltaproteobacteria bacterium]